MTVSLYATTVVAASWSMWARRGSFGCRYEGAPTLAVMCAVLSAYLCSPHAEPLNHLLHMLTGVWNLEDFAGHLVAVVGAAAAVYMGLVRLGHSDEDVQLYFNSWVTLPSIIGVALMQATFVLSGAGRVEAVEFSELGGRGAWFDAYWFVRALLMAHLLIVAGRVVLRLRQYRKTAVLTMYLAAFAGSATCVLLMVGHVVTSYDLHYAARVVGCVAIVLWSMTAAHSWRVKSRIDCQPDVAREDSADADHQFRKSPFAHGE